MWSSVLVTKNQNAYRTIGEASAAIGVPAHVLRFWETKFSQIRPMKKGGGRRYFRPDDILLLSGIRIFLYEREFAIKDLQKLLRSEGVEQVMRAGKTMIAASIPAPTNPSKPIQKKTPQAPRQTTAPAPAKEPARQAPKPAAAPSTDETLRHALAKLQGARAKLSTTVKKI